MSRTAKYLSLWLLLLLVWGGFPLYGQVKKGPVKVATIGVATPFRDIKDMDKVAEDVKSFWTAQIRQVLPDQPDLIVLPEFFDVPGGYNDAKTFREYARVKGEKTRDFLGQIARENRCYIVYGTVLLDKAGLLRNAAVLLDRNGNIAGEYYKNFPTIGEMEDWGMIAGTEVPVFECDFGRVGLAICFDLNFEELRDRFAAQSPDVLLFLSNYHGGHVQSNWAYACRSFFVGSINGRGSRSEVRNPLGEIVASSTNYYNYTVAEINLNSRLVHLGYNVGKLAAVKKKYGPRVSMKDPGYLGPVLLTCEDSSLNIDNVLKEFDIEDMHDYYNRSRAVRKSRLEKNVN